MFIFDYRQQLMERISDSCQDRLCIHREGLVLGAEQARDAYFHMIASDALQLVHLLAPGTVHCFPISPVGALLTAGELYRQLFRMGIRREARNKDCRRLDRLQAELMEIEREPP